MYLVFRSLFVVSLLTTVSFGLAACNTPVDDSVATVEEAAAEVEAEPEAAEEPADEDEPEDEPEAVEETVEAVSYTHLTLPTKA